ncbi:MAG TPA: hypothetical protein VNH18_19840 [Bryobacteraceae bacterium]|nr:hypothetical protein [Bryobacteraceae bacterium]
MKTTAVALGLLTASINVSVLCVIVVQFAMAVVSNPPVLRETTTSSTNSKSPNCLCWIPSVLDSDGKECKLDIAKQVRLVPSTTKTP